MKIEKLPSGSYRIRKMINKKNHSFVFDHKPTKKEIELAIAEIMTAKQPVSKSKSTFFELAEKYLSSNENILSPSTINGYESILKNLSENFLNTLLCDIDNTCIQEEINGYSIDRSPKTVHNAYGFIKRVLTVYDPDLNIRCNLPQMEETDTYVPTPEEAHAIIDAVKGSKYEIPLRLGCYGLRRSEVCALEYPQDLNGNILTVNKALVWNNRKKEWTTKLTKTKQSKREVYLSDELVKLIHDNGCFFNGFPGTIYKRLTDVQNRLGIQHFRLHDLRAYFATELSQAGMSEADILKYGGWSKTNAQVMKRAYRHSRIQDNVEAMEQASKVIDF